MITRDAILIPPWRYTLTRDLGRPGAVVAGCMVNPSTADHRIDDHTIRKWYGFSDRLNIGKFIIVNKFAFQATDVSELKNAADPVGPSKDHYLFETFSNVDYCIVGWGPLAKLPKPLRHRWRHVVAIAKRARCELYCWGTADDGQPRHPLMLSYDTPLAPWKILQLGEAP